MMWLNGKLRETDEAEAILASGAGMTLGWGVFTTLGVRAGEPRFLRRHLVRLERDAREAAVPFDLDSEVVERGLRRVLDANRVRNGLARLTLSRRGDGRWNTRSGADFSILALETPLSGAGLRVGLSPYCMDARRPLPGVKTTSYLPYLWAWQEARARGFDEAILRNERDWLSEGARATLFWMSEGALHTPGLETGCLAGIGRDLALGWASEIGLEARQGGFEAAQAERASEIWLVSVAAGPRSVSSWHDEAGAARATFSAPGPTCAAFALWLDAQTE